MLEEPTLIFSGHTPNDFWYATDNRDCIPPDTYQISHLVAEFPLQEARKFTALYTNMGVKFSVSIGEYYMDSED
jgi:hypothetical protein